MAKDKNKKPFNSLRKKGVLTLAMAGIMAVSPMMLTGCSGEPGPKGDAGATGSNGKSAYELAVENGFQGTEQQWLASLNGGSGKTVEDITGRYHYDEATGKKYYIYTFHYSDGTTEEERLEIAKNVVSLSYTGENYFEMVESGADPILKVNVVYEDLTSEEIVVADDMYVVDGTYVKPNFKEFGTYNVKVSYRGVTTTMSLTVVDPDATQEFTASASLYKNMKKFSHWEDSLGNVISTNLVYTYMHNIEQNYTPVYEDFIEMTGPMFATKGDAWDETNNKYSTTAYGVTDGWMNMAYITEPMKQNMFVEFEVKAKNAREFGFGISKKSYLETYNANPANNGWLSASTYMGLNSLYVAEYNMYSGGSGNTKDAFAALVRCTTHDDPAGKIKFTSPSIDFNSVLSSKSSANANVNIKIVLADKVLVYVENQLYTASNLPTYAINNTDEYFFSFFGNQAEMTVKDFGYVQDLATRGTHTSMTSNPVEKASFRGKTITLIGDSITHGVGANPREEKRYSTVLANSMGMVEQNMGISGTVYCTGGHRTSRINDAYKVDYNSDYVGVLLGINDFDQCKNNESDKYYSLGEFGTKDTSTIYGAVDAMCSILVNRFRFTDTKIFFMTPVITSWNNSVGGNNWDQSKENAWGYTLRELCDAIVEVANYYGIATLDLNTECEMGSADFSDGIHPNNDGMAKMAATIEDWLIDNYSY